MQDYDFYLELAEQIRTRQLDTDYLDKFKKIVKKIASQPYFKGIENSELEVIKKFFLRRERLIGNPYDEFFAEDAAQFLLDLLNKSIVTYNDLDFKKCRWFV